MVPLDPEIFDVKQEGGMNRRLRISAGVVVFFMLSLTGYVRYNFLIDFTGHESMVHSRLEENNYRMPASIDDVGPSISENPKWISSIIYSILYLALSALCIGLLFNKKNFTLITVGVHLLIMFVAVFLIATGLLIHSFHSIYLSAEYLKNLIQSPLLTLILIAGFLLAKTRIVISEP